MRRRVLLVSLAVLGACAPAAGATSRLGLPEHVTTFAGESTLVGSRSAEGHGDAYAVLTRLPGRNAYTVVHLDTAGAVHRFELPTASGSFPQAIRLVALEGGGGMAVWDDGRTAQVLARRWGADGREGPVAIALDRVSTVSSGDNDRPQWQLRTAADGTTVVVSTGLAAGRLGVVVAAVRDPGGAFGPQQELTPPGEADALQRGLAISPFAPDGSVAVAWGPADGGPGPGGRAVRAGRTPFGPPQAAPFTPSSAPGPTTTSGVTADGDAYRLSSRVAALCPCAGVQVLRWADGTRRLTLRRYGTRTAASGDWYVARPGADGTFDRAERATTNGYAVLVRRPRPGEVGVARFDTSTDNGLYRRASRLVVMPFGPRVARSRRPPVVRFGAPAMASATRLLVPFWCDRVCTVTNRSRRTAPVRVVDAAGRRILRRLEPLTVAYLRVPLHDGVTRAAVVLRAVDDAGHRTTARRAYRQSGDDFRTWCSTRARSC